MSDELKQACERAAEQIYILPHYASPEEITAPIFNILHPVFTAKDKRITELEAILNGGKGSQVGALSANLHMAANYLRGEHHPVLSHNTLAHVVDCYADLIDQALNRKDA